MKKAKLSKTDLRTYTVVLNTNMNIKITWGNLETSDFLGSHPKPTKLDTNNQEIPFC